MLFQTLPKTVNSCGVRSLLYLTGKRQIKQTAHRAVVYARTHRVEIDLGSKRITGIHFLCTSVRHQSKEGGGFAEDEQVKEWMKELHKDFNQEPQNNSETERVLETVQAEEKNEDDTESSPQQVWHRLVAEKYQQLDANAQIIYDYDEERLRREDGLEKEEQKPEKIKLERGETGVFDVEELVDLLKEYNAQDLVAIQIPSHLKYADYMVIVSSSSQRHREALSELVRKAYKMKKHESDKFVVPEGKKTNWVALDLGNILLHIMDPETREFYDLETLWTVGPAFDDKSQVSEENLAIGVRQLREPTLPSPPKGTVAEAVM